MSVSACGIGGAWGYRGDDARAFGRAYAFETTSDGDRGDESITHHGGRYAILLLVDGIFIARRVRADGGHRRGGTEVSH